MEKSANEWEEIERSDWRNDPDDFNRLCDCIADLFLERDKLTREKLFRLISEESFRSNIRQCAEKSTRPDALIIYVYLRMKFLVLPVAMREKSA